MHPDRLTRMYINLVRRRPIKSVGLVRVTVLLSLRFVFMYMLKMRVNSFKDLEAFTVTRYYLDLCTGSMSTTFSKNYPEADEHRRGVVECSIQCASQARV